MELNNNKGGVCEKKKKKKKKKKKSVVRPADANTHSFLILSNLKYKM